LFVRPENKANKNYALWYIAVLNLIQT